jgi:hypothetical protein
MAENSGDQERGDPHPYFFLSYAHSGLPYTDADRDQEVAVFFNDLTAAIRVYSRRPPESVCGFFDQQIPDDSTWTDSLVAALGSAEVFVPLYSSAYVAGSWPGREWNCFRRRMELASLSNPMSRFVPVLWAPLEAGQDPPGLREALALGAIEPGYAKNGLRGLMTISTYHRSYQNLVNILARQIVALAEGTLLEPSLIPDINAVESAFAPGPRHAIFVIEAAAPSIQWRPFSRQRFSSAEFARQVAECFGFRTEVSGVMTGRGLSRLRPGLILIDPGFIADDEGKQVLESAIYRLPRWVLPLPILDESVDPHAKSLARRVTDMLGNAGVLTTARHREAAQGARSLREFETLVPKLVVEAERQYLQHRSARVSSPPSAMRPGLRRPMRPDPDAPTTDPSQEVPDA